eukprot:3560865-Prymnesium_polylepis.1
MSSFRGDFLYALRNRRPERLRISLRRFLKATPLTVDSADGWSADGSKSKRLAATHTKMAARRLSGTDGQLHQAKPSN